jgi:hypothetical protein
MQVLKNELDDDLGRTMKKEFKEKNGTYMWTQHVEPRDRLRDFRGFQSDED